MNESYIPLAYLNAWEYCHRRFYFEHVLGEMADNEHIILGRHVHRHIDKETTRREGDTTIHQQQWVWSDRLLISGVIDAVEETHGQLVPIEYKKGRMGRHQNTQVRIAQV
jgi:CRISPR-associated exonuclease Cas4